MAWSQGNAIAADNQIFIIFRNRGDFTIIEPDSSSIFPNMAAARPEALAQMADWRWFLSSDTNFLSNNSTRARSGRPIHHIRL
ncbi:hypothetical protein [[Phormidium] sp. ETS-05]|uniref:hypothetical protein n=1 Tax=[Phormidium] sp. ETS-05 TaxID=222819 RepID=UPI0018EF0AD8|nr:hypothetical protein [[Phormidium] sp. ETS-05]